ncbi:hypothetical protein [Kitasatospora sp. MAP5-34]|nr:hypothetical protein [Kitasatospora sp. MAP5-34]MDH6578224.1 hypothetical protein [Kitasatospora sp. MAP5-34]
MGRRTGTEGFGIDGVGATGHGDAWLVALVLVRIALLGQFVETPR